MPLPAPNPKRIEQYIKNASLKIVVNGEFRGTGFFISRTGYVLTAYHCVDSTSRAMHVRTPYDGDVPAELDVDKSLAQYDLAVLKTTHQPSHYLPLGLVARDQVSDPVVAIGYPASHLSSNQEVGIYRGHISRWRDDDLVELSEVVKGKGQSGGSVYHYASGRVIGVVTDRYKEPVMADSGLLTRLDKLFEKWTELADINQATISVWENRLQLLTNQDLRHRIFFAMLPDDNKYSFLLDALREIVEEKWGCQLLTTNDRQYGDSYLENIRHHIEQSHVLIAEVSEADLEVIFVLGAMQFYLNHVPSILLAQDQPSLPKSLHGRTVTQYPKEVTSLVNALEGELSRVEAIKQLLHDPEREHFLCVDKLKKITRLLLPDKTWETIQEYYPTQESWQQVKVSSLQSLLGKDSDLADVILMQVRQVAL